MTLVGGFTHQGNRAQVLTSLRSMHVAALVLGLGLAAVATFWHMPAPKPFGGLQYKIPSYVKSLENHSESLVNQSLALDNPFTFATNLVFQGIAGPVEFSGQRFLNTELKGIEPNVAEVVGNLLGDAEPEDTVNQDNISATDLQPRYSVLQVLKLLLLVLIASSAQRGSVWFEYSRCGDRSRYR
jgi:hypothetical protein